MHKTSIVLNYSNLQRYLRKFSLCQSSHLTIVGNIFFHSSVGMCLECNKIHSQNLTLSSDPLFDSAQLPGYSYEHIDLLNCLLAPFSRFNHHDTKYLGYPNILCDYVVLCRCFAKLLSHFIIAS